MKLQTRIWLQVLGVIVAMTAILSASFSIAGQISDSETVQLLISAALVTPILLALLVYFEGKKSLHQNFSLDALVSWNSLEVLKYTIPILLSWVPAVAFFSDGPVFVQGWTSYFVGNLLHSCLLEELMFRALVFRRLEKCHTFAKAALYSSILFGLMHMNKVFIATTDGQIVFGLLRVLVSIGSGFFLCVLYKRSRYSLWSPLLFHFAINGIGFFTASDSIAGLAISLAGLAVSFLWIYKESLGRRLVFLPRRA